ncbi:MAG: VOC family protein, partial [Roseibium aggregatum]
MKQMIGAIALIVPEYDQGIDFYVGRLGFDLVEDTHLGGGKRWVLVAP